MVVLGMKYIKKFLQIIQVVSGNNAIRKKICEKNPGTFTENRRNFDVLVIGDMYNVDGIVPKEKMYLQFDAPDRTLFASFLILQCKFSWLREGAGKCIILCKKENEKKRRISMFDIPFLHKIIVKKYRLGRQQTQLNYPLLFHPIQVSRFLSEKKYNKSSIEKCPLSEIEDFCRQRNIELEYRLIK